MELLCGRLGRRVIRKDVAKRTEKKSRKPTVRGPPGSGTACGTKKSVSCRSASPTVDEQDSRQFGVGFGEAGEFETGGQDGVEVGRQRARDGPDVPADAS